jgi:excisionase family DNA binding protein
MEIEKQTLTIEEAAKILGIGRNNAYLAARNGQLPTIKIGKRLLVPVIALKRKLEGASNDNVGKGV